MASALLRASAVRGSAFRRAASAAPAVAAAASGGEGLAGRRAVSLPSSPLRRLMNSGAPTDQPSKSPDEKAYKIDQMELQVKEMSELVERDLMEVLEKYKTLQAADHGYFERFLTRCKMPKSKFRDRFIWSCELATLFVLSAAVGHLLAGVRTSEKHSTDGPSNT